ncbi:cell division cycle- protein [Actinomortierella wolfii]|nr:cell division cycle- protein [Actinomortierella wolfii]
MDPSTTTGNSLDAAAAQAAALTASKVDSSHQPPRSTREAQAENAPLPDASTELTTDKGLQSQAASKTKRPRSSIFDPSSTTVSHWSKRPRKSVVSKPTSVAPSSKVSDSSETNAVSSREASGQQNVVRVLSLQYMFLGAFYGVFPVIIVIVSQTWQEWYNATYTHSVLQLSKANGFEWFNDWHGVSADVEAEEDYSFLVTPNVMAVSDEILSMSSPYPIDDLETLVSQESTCDECSSCSSSIPLPCPDYVLQPLDERPLEWQHNRPTQDVPLTETVADTITTTKSASAPEPDENAELIRPVLMSRSKTLQATSVAHIEGASYTSPLRRPNGGFRRHKTMQGIKNEFKVASAAAHGGNKAASVIDSQQPVPTTLPPREAEENQILPFTDPLSGSNDFAKRISPTTMVDVLEGKYKSQYDVLMLIDCRFAYEYKGGHIKSAVNIHDKRELDRVLFEKSPLIHKRVLVILHCEFSCERGPGMAKHLRSMDRTANSINYPALYYPELYVLDGGYSRFFKEYPDYCTPQNYVSMLDPAYRQEYERARVAHRSAFGRTVSKGFLGMESNAQLATSQPSAKNFGHSSNISQTTGNSNNTITTTNSSSSSGKSSKATTVGLGLRGRSRTIPDLRSIAKLNVEQFRQYARAAKEAH